MTRKLATYLNKKKKVLAVLTQCLLLLFKNLILIRPLKIQSVCLYDLVVIQGNEIELFWKVRGCHKIKIKGLGVFPGNTAGLKFIFSNRHNPIEVTFYGILKGIKKKIRIENTKINLLDRFMATAKLPVVIEVPYCKQRLQSNLSNYSLKELSPNIYFEFEPFNIDNYKPVNTIQE